MSLQGVLQMQDPVGPVEDLPQQALSSPRAVRVGLSLGYPQCHHF